MQSLLKILLSLFIFIFLLSSPVSAQEHIKNFDTKIKINQDGTIEVKESIIYDFDQLERHGIYRDIPFISTNKAGKKFKLEFANFSVTDENEKKYQVKRTI